MRVSSSLDTLNIFPIFLLLCVVCCVFCFSVHVQVFILAVAKFFVVQFFVVAIFLVVFVVLYSCADEHIFGCYMLK